MTSTRPTLAERVKHEEELINRRLTWMLLFQGFLFTAAVSAAKNDLASRLGTIIPWVGFASAFLTFLGVLGAYRSIDTSRRGSHSSKENLGDMRIGRILGRSNSLGLTILLFGSWLFYLFGPK
jgi:hypothetical protein